MGRTSVGLNCGLTVEQHGSSAEASGLMQVTVVSTTQEVSRISESSEGFMFKLLELASKHSLEHEGLVCDKAIGTKATPFKFRFAVITDNWVRHEYGECVDAWFLSVTPSGFDRSVTSEEAKSQS